MNTRAPLSPGERTVPSRNPFLPVKWRRPAASINPFGPPPQPWERGHYGFRFAYDRARAIFQAGDAIEAFAEGETMNPALVAPELFAAAVSAVAHDFRDAIPSADIPAVARAVALVAWHDALADHADRRHRRCPLPADLDEP